MPTVLARQEREESPAGFVLAGVAGLALATAGALPDAKVGFGLLGASLGSHGQGVAFFSAELLGWLLGLLALLNSEARRRVPAAAWWVAGLWCLALAWGGVQGWRQGAALRDILAEGRAALLAPVLLGLLGLTPRGWTLAVCSATWGLLLGLLLQALLLTLEPTGLYNENVVPVPVLMVQHSLPWILLLGLGSFALLFRQALRPSASRAFTLLLLWGFFWLTFLRSLWVALALGTAGAVAALLLGGRKAAGLRLLSWQVVLAVLGLGLALGLERGVTPDGDYLLRFRLMRLAQAVHLAEPPPPMPVLDPPVSAVMRGLARRGGLYRNLVKLVADEPSAAEQRAEDPSQLDRGMMRRLSWEAYIGHPLAGAGLGSLVRYSIPGFERAQRDPHQGYVWLLKCGALGILAGAALLLVPFAAALGTLRQRHGWVPAWALAALCTLAGAELLHVGFLQVPTLLAWAVVAAAALRPEPA